MNRKELPKIFMMIWSLPGLFFYCVYWAFSEIMPSWFNSHSIIRSDLGIIRRPDHCSDCLLSSIWPSTKHYLDVTNRPHWSSISVMYFQRFWRWPIFNQLRAKVACFLANNAWYPCLCEQLSNLNRRPALRHTALWRIERGVAGGTTSSVQRTQNKHTTI